MTRIASTANPRVKALVRLRRRREREATGTFLVDGEREIERALAAGLTIEELYVCPPPDGEDRTRALAAQARDAGVPVTSMDAAPFARASYGQRTSGALAVARRFDTALDALALSTAPLLLVVEGIEKPGNLGTMLRTAAAAGVDAVLVADPATDLFNPNVIRASLGAVFDVPLAVADAGRARRWLAAAAIPWLASSGAGGRSLWTVDLTGPVALVVGSEDRGLTGDWLTDPSRVLHIPTSDRQPSLNAAMAAGILLFEAARQRAEAHSAT